MRRRVRKRRIGVVVGREKAAAQRGAAPRASPLLACPSAESKWVYSAHTTCTHRPCIDHASTMHRPCIDHASTMHRPASTMHTQAEPKKEKKQRTQTAGEKSLAQQNKDVLADSSAQVSRSDREGGGWRAGGGGGAWRRRAEQRAGLGVSHVGGSRPAAPYGAGATPELGPLRRACTRS